MEPFAGSACLFFRLQPAKALLGDINRDLIGTYLEVKYRVEAVAEELSRLEKGRDHYESLRAADVSVLSPSQRRSIHLFESVLL